MSRIRFTPSELAERTAVWEALSTLFLDTDVSLLRNYRVRTLAPTRFTIAELQHILIEEVYPIGMRNFLWIAGEWAGFDPAWLAAAITRRLNRRFRPFSLLNIGRLSMPLSLEWRRTKAAIASARHTSERDRS